MAGGRCNWVKPLAVAVHVLCAGILVCAQSTPSGSLTGRLTDLRSAPLAGTTVVLRKQSTGTEARAITARDGGYRFQALEAGKYSLEAVSPKLGHGQLNDIQISAGHEARV